MEQNRNDRKKPSRQEKSNRNEKQQKEKRKAKNAAKREVRREERHTVRSRMIAYVLDKLREQERQKDTLSNLLKDLLTIKLAMYVKRIMPVLLIGLAVILAVIGGCVAIVIGVIAMVYHSPLGILLPPFDDGETVREVASAYVAEFQREVDTLVTEHAGCDEGMVIYAGYEDSDVIPNNLNDILVVYMVRHGDGELAVSMTEENKEKLQAIVDDMCAYTTEMVTVSENQTDLETPSGTPLENTEGAGDGIKRLNVTVELKTYEDMVPIYEFSESEMELMEVLMEHMP